MAECIRRQLELLEHSVLSPAACFADASAGRPRPEKQCDFRTDFQRDTDRIVHSMSFLRLKQKTQVFLSPQGDHYITRLTHTLQVSQIARTMARALRLNENLTEAIALGHDVGHTPFGHAGEWALDEMSGRGFRHYEHSVRVLQRLEKDGRGLNLTREVTDGILRHTCGEWASTAEGRLVRLADRIAYVNHDIEDAVRAGIIRADDIPRPLLENLGRTKSERITTLVRGVVENGAACGFTGVGARLEPYFDRLHEFMYERVYNSPVAKSEESKAVEMVKTLYRYFSEHPDRLPEKRSPDADDDQAIVDYIAGMTDRYAVSVFENIFVPKGWGA